jgi:predicted protein tyrosine phosphatase
MELDIKQFVVSACDRLTEIYIWVDQRPKDNLFTETVVHGISGLSRSMALAGAGFNNSHR